MRRIPSIEIIPKDKEKLRKELNEKRMALNQLGEFFEKQKDKRKPKLQKTINICKNL